MDSLEFVQCILWDGNSLARVLVLTVCMYQGIKYRKRKCHSSITLQPVLNNKCSNQYDHFNQKDKCKMPECPGIEIELKVIMNRLRFSHTSYLA